MDLPYLVRPSLAYEAQYRDFYQDWTANGGGGYVPWTVRKDPSDFPAMLRFLQNHEDGVDLPEGWVPSTTLWYVNGAGRVIGCVNVRHRMTERLLLWGGHIGYGIRPADRGKGYGTRLVGLALEAAVGLGIRRMLLCPDEANLASRKVIEANGGVLQDRTIEEDGTVVCRYWIEK